MDPRRVLTFRAVAHRRSFSGAARELSLSQPSVSNQVAALERELGARAARARARRPAAHRRGRDPARARRRDRRALRARRHAARRRRPAASARGCGSARSRPRSPGSCRRRSTAAARAPGEQGDRRRGRPATCPARVRSGELHLALAFQDSALPRVEPRELERRDLLRERFLVALAPGHRLARRAAVRLADLRDDDWTAALTDGLIVRACRAAGFEPNLVSITRDQLAIRALVLRGLAVTLVPQCSPRRSTTSRCARSPGRGRPATSTRCCHPAPGTRSSRPTSLRFATSPSTQHLTVPAVERPWRPLIGWCGR